MTNWERKEEREVVTGNLWRAKSWCHRTDPSMNHARGRPRGAGRRKFILSTSQVSKEASGRLQGYVLWVAHSGCTGNPRTWSFSKTRYILSFHHIGNSTVIISPDSRVLLTICLEGCKAWPSKPLWGRGPPVTHPHDYNPMDPTKWKAGKKKKFRDSSLLSFYLSVYHLYCTVDFSPSNWGETVGALPSLYTDWLAN